MRIGIDAREFKQGKITGIGRYLSQFLKYATENSSAEFILFCNQYTEFPFEFSNFKKVFIQEYLTFFYDQISLPLNIWREKIDVFLTPYFKAPIFIPSKIVLIINDLIPLLVPEEINFIKRLYFKILCKKSANRADRIITISKKTKEDLIKFFKISSEKIEVIHLGVEERYKQMKEIPEEIKKKYFLPEKFILYVGNLNLHKNVDNLIKAYANLQTDLKNKYKLVLGTSKEGENYLRIKNLIEKHKLKDNIIITGFIEEKDLPLVYNLSSLFVFPSLYEGFGLPVLEAMACGVPVISSNRGAIPEVIGDAGILINPESIEEISSSIIKVLENEELRKIMIEKGLERAKNFTIKKMAESFLKVLCNLI